MAVSVVLVAAVAGGGFAVTALGEPQSEEGRVDREGRAGLPPATASVVKGDLSNSTGIDGTLGYSQQRKVNAGTAGTLTWITSSGSKIKRDGRLYAVNGQDVRLMYGAEPMYRTLKTGSKGTDVRQLEENLRDLGYGTGLAIDDEYTAGTADAVKRWQKAHGLKQTGQVGPEQIAFAAGPVRIQSADVAVGDQAAPGQAVLTTTGSDRVVRLEAKVSEASLARTGGEVAVELPDGTVTKGTVTSVASVAKPGSDPNDRTPRISIVVTFDDPAEVKGFDKSPATVKFDGETRRNVLSVPVGALLALEDGSFGVQVVEGGEAREVKVKLGLFAQGQVEVTGDGLSAGMKVGVPNS
ncbi:peptidoglycan-binding protein [Streptomyces albipurpureus]|uniref:Peptidoglycan-binding protein n=1 Tax=Streptomyces albipurpureus TaxID=2897419 RepID=A0ABT0UJA7_9ACTN|nr:peptidoglycan-binding protein [Streptomyces sp. CWNU-1]MCM2388175.1 peptidoglycan-binding protein [Streptomyces sp. CWNU-1]